MDYQNPLVYILSNKKFSAYNNQPNMYRININQPWNFFKDELQHAKNASQYDSVIVQYDKDLLNDNQHLKTLDIHTSGITQLFKQEKVPVVTIHNQTAYKLNATYHEGENYVEPNDKVLQKYDSYGDKYNWQHHQSQVWDKIRSINELSNGTYGADHVSILTSANRGLNKEDVKDFFSIRNGKVINPSLVDDDMVGMPGINASEMKDTFSYKGRQLNDKTLSLTMMGNGYVIPMRNVKGDMAKFQIGADVNRYNATLKASASDGITIQSSEIYDKKSDTYQFQLQDGTPSELKIVQGTNQSITFEDVKGQFSTPLKQDILPILKERGYDIPPLIHTLKSQPRSKYAWSAPGNMVGAKTKTVDTPKLVSPSEAGFINVREPRTPEAGYSVLVVEGALKGHIVATYLQKEEMQDFTDEIAGDRGLIVAQVPGVSKAFIRSVTPICEEYDVKDAIVAMDADGRFNLSVTRGIHDATNILSNIPSVRVMSWNPEQKGLDDALIALHRQQITKEDFDLTFGTAEELFPLDQASAPNPYKLDGTRANKLSWQLEYEESKKHRVSDSLYNQTKPVLKHISSENVSKIDALREQDMISDDDLLEFVNEVYALQETIKSRTDSFVDKFTNQEPLQFM